MKFYKFTQKAMVVQQQEGELWKHEKDGVQRQDQVAKGT